PDATYLRAFATIYPAHLFDGRTRLVDDPYGRGPVGTGPFRFREWAPGDHLTLARNPIYREAGRPYLDELVFRFFPDAAAAAAARPPARSATTRPRRPRPGRAPTPPAPAAC